MDFSADDIRLILKDYQPNTEDVLDGLRPASVLEVLYPRPDGLSLIFTKRTDHLDNHSGQISFPGGMRDPGDPDSMATALREAHEEIGLRPEDVEVLGRLNQEATITAFSVAPFVGVIPYPYDFNLQTFEVERLIVVPLSHLLDPDHFGVDMYKLGAQSYKTYKYTFEGDVIWGATARMVHNLLSLLTTGREPDELEHLKKVVAAHM